MAFKAQWFYSFVIIGTFYGIRSANVQALKTIKVTSVLAYPYLNSRANDSGGYYGFIVDLLEAVAERVGGVEFDITLVNDGHYGSRLPNGTWDGMIGEVIRGDAEMIAAPLTVNVERSEVLDFSNPFQVSRLALLMKKSLPNQLTFKQRLLKLLEPMKDTVWGIICFSYFIVSTVLYIIARFNPYEWRKLNKDGMATFRERESFDCANTFWFVMSTFAWQGYVRSPRSTGGRIVTMAWWMFVVFVIVLYTASLTNMIRLGPNPDAKVQMSKVHSFEDLNKYNDISFSIIANGSTQSTISSHSRYSTINERLDSDSAVGTIGEGVRRLRGRVPGEHAFILESTFARPLSGNSPCDLYTIEAKHTSRFYAFGFIRKNFKYAQVIDKALFYLRENGRIGEIVDKWFSGSCEEHYLASHRAYERYRGLPHYKVDLATFSGIVVFLLIGVVLGGLVTIIEVIIFRYVEATPLDEDEPLPVKDTTDAHFTQMDNSGEPQDTVETNV